jgi:predicted RNase H-like nuclease (RuvC/YqgF family)
MSYTEIENVNQQLLDTIKQLEINVNKLVSENNILKQQVSKMEKQVSNMEKQTSNMEKDFNEKIRCLEDNIDGLCETIRELKANQFYSHKY